MTRQPEEERDSVQATLLVPAIATHGPDGEGQLDGKQGKDLDPEGTGEDGFERALDAVGVGRFQYILLLICGWAIASDSVEVGSVRLAISER